MLLFSLSPDHAGGAKVNRWYAELDRPTTPGAAAIRTRLESWFAHYPANHQPELRRRFMSKDSDFQSALLELTIHELMQTLGYEAIVHPELPAQVDESSGSRPDFYFSYQGAHGFYLEAVNLTDPLVGILQRLNQLVERFNEVDSGQYQLILTVDEPFGRLPSKRNVQENLNRWLDGVNPVDVAESYSLQRRTPKVTATFKFDGGTAKLWAIPRQRGSRTVWLTSPGIGFRASGPEALRSRIRGKAKNYKAIERPLVIALNYIGPRPDPDVNPVVFGSLSRLVFHDGGPIPTNEPGVNAVFLDGRKPAYTRISAVLLLQSLTPYSIDEALRTAQFSKNPWAARELKGRFADIGAGQFPELS